MNEMTPDAALAIALGSAYLSALLYFLWPVTHKCQFGNRCIHNREKKL